MLKKSILILIVSVLLTTLTAVEYSNEKVKQYMGLNISDICGSGLIYRLSGTPLGLGIILGGAADGEEGAKFDSYFNGGAMATYKLKDFTKSTFFYFLGGSYHYRENRHEIEPLELEINGKDYTTDVKEEYYYGMGLGFDLFLNEWGVFSIQWPLTFRDDGYISMYVPMASLMIRFK